MQREWPQFSVAAGTSPMSVMWFGPLVGMERSFTLSVQYGLPFGGRSDLFRLIPLVRVLSPAFENGSAKVCHGSGGIVLLRAE